ncbi:unnamed protein product [Fraxinus pennsylvanica]|uniref:Phospholipase A(2) n=1 Tax=Fraxinus pennsylvanica TaxID=56036 RepID=A0AAD2E8B9_9LAMI|nr:unnamed protein product [Fraxinus pennsylvanica]
MLPGNAIVHRRRLVATALIRCSKTCVAENYNTVGIKYRKYCGVGWTGCPGEKPCDDLDACCKIHDEGVEKNDGKEVIARFTDINNELPSPAGFMANANELFIFIMNEC